MRIRVVIEYEVIGKDLSYTKIKQYIREIAESWNKTFALQFLSVEKVEEPKNLAKTK